MLNVSSVATARDLTASARIVAAAFNRFARQGFASTTVRQIAADAGVSAALVLHHFGSKDGVRRECDRRVIEFVREKGRNAAGTAIDDAFARYGTYAARTIADDPDESRELFDALLQSARETVEAETGAGRMRRSSDPDAQAVALLVLGLAPFTFAQNIGRWAGAGPDEGMSRLAVPIAEIYTHGLVAHDGLLDAVRANAADAAS